MEKNKIHIYLYNALIVLCLLGGAVYVVSQFMHFGGGEFTDNARVRQTSCLRAAVCKASSVRYGSRISSK